MVFDHFVSRQPSGAPFRHTVSGVARAAILATLSLSDQIFRHTLSHLVSGVARPDHQFAFSSSLSDLSPLPSDNVGPVTRGDEGSVVVKRGTMRCEALVWRKNDT